jgi:FtsH-binding integral membrane protein
MAAGLALTGSVASLMAHSDFHASLSQMPLLMPFVWPLQLAPIGLVMLLWLNIEEMSFFAAQAVFWLYAALMGFSLGCIVLVYTGVNIAPVAFSAGGTFAAMSLYGYATATDLSKLCSFLIMGLMGVVLACLVNIFLASTALHFAVSTMGVIVFVGLTAWDAERVKEMYFESNGGVVLSKKALMGALALFFDANPFALLLRLESARRD